MAATRSNFTQISIPKVGMATPYLSTITVSGLKGRIADLNVTIHGLWSDFPDDVAIMLVGPRGHTVILMSDVGGGVPAGLLSQRCGTGSFVKT